MVISIQKMIKIWVTEYYCTHGGKSFRRANGRSLYCTPQNQSQWTRSPPRAKLGVLVHWEAVQAFRTSRCWRLASGKSETSAVSQPSGRSPATLRDSQLVVHASLQGRTTDDMRNMAPHGEGPRTFQHNYGERCVGIIGNPSNPHFNQHLQIKTL